MRTNEITKSMAMAMMGRIMSGFEVDPIGGCWNWKRAKAGQTGYGITTLNKRNYYVHRVMFVVMRGEIERDKLVCHTCDNPACVNPAHLFSGTHGDNANDMYRKGRGFRAQGAKSASAKIADEDVYNIRRAYDFRLESPASLAARFNVSAKTISTIGRRMTWKHLPEKWDAPRRDYRFPKSKFGASSLPEIRRLKMLGENNTAIAKKFGVTQGCISRIVNGKTWTNF